MTYRFNSGMGGWTCDKCNVLLWAGWESKEYPENRVYCYNETADSITETETEAFCKECSEEENNE